MRDAMVLVITALALTPAYAQDQDHQHDEPVTEASTSGEAPIKITINPEARISVSRDGELPVAAACGRAIELPVKIVNQGVVTSSLEASLLESIPGGTSLEFPADSLDGNREERWILRITLREPGLWDITIGFRARNDISDLGGRDRIHLLLRCN